MPISPGALICAGLAIALLVYSGAWTDRTYRRFDKIPGHYDWRGNATRLDSRRQMAWLLPAIFSFLIVGFAAMVWVTPAGMVNGNPSTGLVFTSLVLLAIQGLVLRLLARWARGAGNPE